MSIHYIEQTKAWVQDFVIRHNLCPFAQHPFAADTVRYTLQLDDNWQVFAQQLIQELQYINNTPASTTETTLLIYPNALEDFEDYLEFLDLAQQFLEELELEGIIQIASFHPNYQFAATTINDPENYTNRSPYPMLHLLREDSISKATEHYPQIEEIPAKNIAKLRALGIDELKKQCHEFTRTP